MEPFSAPQASKHHLRDRAAVMVRTLQADVE
jgi:hypothetical protein